MEVYLVKENCGTHIVFDQGELDRHIKMGWEKRPDDWLEKEQAAKRAKRAADLKAELAKLEATEDADVALDAAPAQPKKRGRKPKAAE